MKKPSRQTILVFFWVLNLDQFFFSSSFNNTSSHLCSYDQARALLEFKKSMSISINASEPPLRYSARCSSSHPRTNSWHEDQDCCHWDGVWCDTTTGQVIGLDLSCSWLQGRLSSNSSLFLLQHLEILNLAYNNFTGSEISPQLSQLHGLTHLNLSRSYFIGEVPMEISYLTNLVSLDLSSYSSDGITFKRLTMRSITMKNLGQNLTKLKELNLQNVDLYSVEPNSLWNLSSSLTFLVLDGLKGIFPTSIFQLPNLQVLHLSSHSWDLQVSLPTSNWSATSLMELVFDNVNFKNGLPSSIGNLKSLKYLDASQCGIDGLIPDSIGNLTSIEYLDLSRNELAGSLPNFSNLSFLHTLNLHRNSLTGIIPFSLYSLPLLRTLDLSYNLLIGGQLHPFRSQVLETIDLLNCSLQGPIPAILFPHGASQLTTINFSLNSLNGTIPSSLFSLPSLLGLDLSYNRLGGGIPEIISTSLKGIYLSNNKLQGNIPSSIYRLANLIGLSFSSNNLSGTIDTSMLSNLQSLIDLDGSNNMLSFTSSMNHNRSLPNLRNFYFSSNNVVEFPIFLRGSKVLLSLDLSNNKIDGRVPDWLCDVGRDTLNYLNLAHNNLIGINKLSWTRLQYIDLRSNLLRGPLPLPPSRLVAYFMSNNSLTGDISTLICNTSFMQILDLSKNNFTGTIPECLRNISLYVLDLSTNKFHGRIPKFCDHNKRSLKTLNLNGNQLDGKLPISLGNCEKLEVINIGKNTINDTFPHWLQFLAELKVLVLKSNNFHGYIRDYQYSHSFQKLRMFDISNNNFVGSMPTKYIQSLEAMKVGIDGSNYMDSYYGGSSSYYQDYVSLTIKGNDINVERILTTFMTIDFSNNKFTREIPQVIGTLINLKSLNLSNNILENHIPASIGNLKNLESLDLSSNMLTGTIPKELASISFLGKLNLSQNALVGPIPSVNHFDTRFDNSSYQENLALCGPPLSKTCSNENNEKPPPILPREEGSDDFDRKIILYGYISGLVIGLSIGYMVFSGELPIWFVKMIQRYQLRKLNRRISTNKKEKL